MYVCVRAYVCIVHFTVDDSFNAIIQAIPIIRGEGVYQKAVDYCIALLNEGAWIHVFPEGYLLLVDHPSIIFGNFISPSYHIL